MDRHRIELTLRNTGTRKTSVEITLAETSTLPTLSKDRSRSLELAPDETRTIALS